MRTPLPSRRPHETATVYWNGQAFPVSIGLRWPDAQKDDNGNIVPFEIADGDLIATMQPADVFADLGKGGDLQWVVADACVLISVAMQHGVTLDDLGKSLGRVPALQGDDDATLPASPLGAIIETLQEGAVLAQKYLTNPVDNG